MFAYRQDDGFYVPNTQQHTHHTVNQLIKKNKEQTNKIFTE